MITVNAYERNPKARVVCIDHYGLTCSVCDFNFQDVYGTTEALLFIDKFNEFYKT